MYNLGVNLSSLNYQVFKTKKRYEIIENFIKICEQEKISGIEFYPSSFYKNFHKISNNKNISNDLAKINNKGLFYILDCDKVFNLEAIKKLIKLIKNSKKKIIVLTLTKILECNRHLIKKDWKELIEDSIKFLKKLEPIARDNNVKIAIENHQDLDSNDFLKLLDKFKTDTIGINFDIGNAYAVCEDPMTFCKKIVHKINSIHLKDYKIYETKKGFMLSNCTIGEGEVKFKKIIDFVNNHKNVTKMIEPGQLIGRHIKKNNKIFWKKIGSRAADERKIFDMEMSYILKKNKNMIFKSPLELKKKDEEIFSFLNKQLLDSIKFCKLI